MHNDDDLLTPGEAAAKAGMLPERWMRAVALVGIIPTPHDYGYRFTADDVTRVLEEAERQGGQIMRDVSGRPTGFGPADSNGVTLRRGQRVRQLNVHDSACGALEMNAGNRGVVLSLARTRATVQFDGRTARYAFRSTSDQVTDRVAGKWLIVEHEPEDWGHG